MAKEVRPISINEFPNISTNCLGFAIGETMEIKKADLIFNLDPKYSIEKAFEVKLSELGYSTSNLRRIEFIEDANPNEYIFKIYGFNKCYYNFMGFRLDFYDFHVVRRELDKSWVHKPGWEIAPCIIEESDWTAIEEEFGKNFVLFALSNSPEEE